MSEELNQAQQVVSQGWYHWVPFAALMAATPPPMKNRPLATRISEQVLVAILAGGGGAYTVNDTMSARHDEQIKALQDTMTLQTNILQKQIDASEQRMIDQIKELRENEFRMNRKCSR